MLRRRAGGKKFSRQTYELGNATPPHNTADSGFIRKRNRIERPRVIRIGILFQK